jgi:hypothetical protein
MASKSRKATRTHQKSLATTPAEEEKSIPVKNPNIKDWEDGKNRFFLEQKLTYVNTIAHVCMTWWVSSVVFCASILAGVWLKRTELVESGMIHLLGAVLTIFFASIVIFGGLVRWLYLPNLHKEISDFSGITNGTRKNFFSTELSAFKKSMVLGTGSFFLILLVWIALWIGLSYGWWEKKDIPTAQPNNSFNRSAS